MRLDSPGPRGGDRPVRRRRSRARPERDRQHLRHRPRHGRRAASRRRRHREERPDGRRPKRSPRTSNGAFVFPLMPVGVYDVSAALQGFTPSNTGRAEVSVGADTSLKLAMALAGVKEAIAVTAETPVVEITKSEQASAVNETYIQNLPANGRNFIDFVLTTPGVTKDPRLGDISFAGQRGTLNSLVVDGADNNNTFFGQALGRTGSGRAPYQFSQDAVKEFQVNSNAYSAEYGRAGGAVINVVTKSGTNDFHGSAFEFYRDKALNANNYINVINGRPKSPLPLQPVRRRRSAARSSRTRLFFFANYDGQRNTNAERRHPEPAVEPARPTRHAGRPREAAAARGHLGPRPEPGRLPRQDGPRTSAPNAQLSLRYNHQNFTGEDFENGGTTQPSSTRATRSSRRTRSTASLTSSFGAVALQRAARPVRARTTSPAWRTARTRRPIVAGAARPCSRSAATSSARARRRSSATRSPTPRRCLLGEPHDQGRLRLQPRRHPELLPGQLLRRLHVQLARVVQPRDCRHREYYRRPSREPARSGPTRTRPRRSRSSRRTSGGCTPTSRSTSAFATTCRHRPADRAEPRRAARSRPASTRASSRRTTNNVAVRARASRGRRRAKTRPSCAAATASSTAARRRS